MPENAEKKESLFREKSLKRLENPEKLNDYLRVTSPGVWLVLAAVIVLLAGVCLWGFFGKIEVTVPAAVITENGKSVCMVPKAALDGVISNRTVRVEKKAYELQPSSLIPQVISEETNIYEILAGKLSVGDIVYPIELVQTLEGDGILSGALVTETMSPVSLFFDKE